MKIHHKSALNNPKVVVMAVVILLIVMGAAVWMAAVQQWQNVASQAEQQSDKATALKQQALSTEATREGRSKAILALAGLKRGSFDGTWWFGWQAAVWDNAKEAKNTCEAAYSRTSGLSKAAASLQKYLSDEVAIINQLERLVVDSKAKDWQTRAASASSAAYAELNALELDSSIKPVQKEAVKRVKEVRDAWKALKTADSKKDRIAYSAALNKLDDAYVQLASITEASSEQLTVLVDSLKAAK